MRPSGSPSVKQGHTHLLQDCSPRSLHQFLSGQDYVPDLKTAKDNLCRPFIRYDFRGRDIAIHIVLFTLPETIPSSKPNVSLSWRLIPFRRDRYIHQLPIEASPLEVKANVQITTLVSGCSLRILRYTFRASGASEVFAV